MHREDSLPYSHINVLGRSMAYTEIGRGDPILFLHGNPTSSYLWRNVMPPVSAHGRCIAPDLIGMGRSEKLNPVDADTYQFTTHRDYLDAFIDAMGIADNLTLVLHDWGSALGFDWANRHREQIKRIAYMEAIVRPIQSWDEWNKDATPIFQGFRSNKGETLILERNLFIERVLPGSILRTLSDAEMAIYRAPFANAESDRWPTLTWPRQIPIAGSPADVVAIVAAYANWLVESATLPKLFINADPGAILLGPLREFCRSWPNQTEVTVPGNHFLQEDSGPEIGNAIAQWLSATRG